MKISRLTLALLFLVIAGFAQTPQTHLKVGDKAPDFALPNGDGKLVMLSEYTARTPVLVIFYRGFW